jgi:hypothetical protein
MTLEEFEAARREVHRDFEKVHVAMLKDRVPYVVSCIQGDVTSYEKNGYEVLEICPTIHHAREVCRRLIPSPGQADTIRARREAVRAKYPAGSRITNRDDIAALYGKQQWRGVNRED